MATDNSAKRRIFAKLFDYKDSQILVKLSFGDAPVIRFFYWPSDDLDICSTSIMYEGPEDDTYQQAIQAFEEIDEAKAIEAIRPILRIFGGLDAESHEDKLLGEE